MKGVRKVNLNGWKIVDDGEVILTSGQNLDRDCACEVGEGENEESRES